MKQHITKDEWVDLFRETGLDEAMMETWHKLFEARHPEGHEGFLNWLGLSAPEIQRIRSESR